MFFLLSLLSLMSVSFGQRSRSGSYRERNSSLGSCQFSRDCKAHVRCQNIADASCVCNFGQCVISGSFRGRGSECNKFTDCACKNDPASCFCRGGFCRETKWECHEADDCNKLNKCRGKNCACTGRNLCESDCVSDADCKDFYCNKALGYMCKCENSLCAYKKKTTECKNISDCISQGKCTAAAPCACTQEFCTLPWWVAKRDEVANCRTDQDCESTIFDCRGNKCACQNEQPINGYDTRGTCGPMRKTTEEE